jgi:hypothetical protein
LEKTVVVVTSQVTRDARAWKCLHDVGVLRLTKAPPEALGPGFWYFERGEDVRVLVGGPGLFCEDLEVELDLATEIACAWTDPLAYSARAHLKRALTTARIPPPSLLCEDMVKDGHREDWDPAGTLAMVDSQVRSLAPLLDPREITEAHQAFLAVLERSRDTGAQPGADSSGGAWYVGREWAARVEDLGNRWRYSFGKPTPGPDGRLRVPVRLSVGKMGDEHVGNAVYARDVESPRLFLVLHGRLRYGRRRISKDVYWSLTRARGVPLEGVEDEPDGRTALVVEVGVPDAGRQMAAFTAEASRIANIDEETTGRADRSSLDEGEDEGPEIQFLDLDDPDIQAALVWESLLGFGEWEKDAAVQVAARMLREDGLLTYKRLDPRGAVYAEIEAAIERGIRVLGMFDRPRRGFVRAICPEPQTVPGWVWYGAMALEVEGAGEAIDREEAVQKAALHLVERIGLRHQRLRKGGVVDTELRKAISRGLRQGVWRAVGRNKIQAVRELPDP